MSIAESIDFLFFLSVIRTVLYTRSALFIYASVSLRFVCIIFITPVERSIYNRDWEPSLERSAFGNRVFRCT